MNKYQALVDMIEHGNSKGALDALEKLRDEDRDKAILDKCNLEYVDGYLRCTYNHKVGDPCLMHKCYYCDAVGYDLCPNHIRP